MTLHVPTLLLVTSVVFVVVAVGYLSRIWGNPAGATPADRIWSVTSLAVVTSGLSYTVAQVSQDPRTIDAIGGFSMTLAFGLLWSGVRAMRGRSVRVWVPALVSLLVVATELSTPELDSALSLTVLYGVIVAWSTLTLREVIDGGLAQRRGGFALTVVLGCFALYNAARIVVLHTQGQATVTHSSVFGTGTATLINAVLVAIAAIALLELNSVAWGRTPDGGIRFDSQLGTRLPGPMRARAEQVFAADAARFGEIGHVVVVVEIAELDAIGAAYGARAADVARVIGVDTVVERALPGALIGALDTERSRFVVVMDGDDDREASRWVADLRDHLLRSPLRVEGDVIHLALHDGIATGTGTYEELLRAATESLLRPRPALSAGSRPSEGDLDHVDR